MPGIDRTLRYVALAALLAAVAACSASQGHSSKNAPSIDAAELSVHMSEGISVDLVSEFQKLVGPGTVTVFFQSDGSVFASALEKELRNSGYAIVSGDSEPVDKFIPLSFLTSPFESTVIVRISTDKIQLARAYVSGALGAVPASPLSVMSLDTSGGN